MVAQAEESGAAFFQTILVILAQLLLNPHIHIALEILYRGLFCCSYGLCGCCFFGLKVALLATRHLLRHDNPYISLGFYWIALVLTLASNIFSIFGVGFCFFVLGRIFPIALLWLLVINRVIAPYLQFYAKVILIFIFI